jgi:hypothetical protein
LQSACRVKNPVSSVSLRPELTKIVGFKPRLSKTALIKIYE